MKKLLSDIKNKTFKNVYLFYGDEKYLIRHYENQLKSILIPRGMESMNIDVFDGKSTDIQDIIDAVSTAPFMSARRLIIVRDSALFALGRKIETEKMADFITLINGKSTSVLLFIESQTDKRNKLYKKAADMGGAVEFKAQSEKDLIKWIRGMAGKRSITISDASAVILLRTVAGDMDMLEMELDKLASYKNTGEINKEDIEAVCTKALDTRIFDLIDAVGRKDKRKAMNIFLNLMLMKEYPIVVLSLLAKRFGQILRCKTMDGRSESEIAACMKIHSFVVRECVKQSRNFTWDNLIAACNDCFETDFNIKTGQIAAQTGVELLIIRYSS